MTSTKRRNTVDSIGGDDGKVREKIQVNYLLDWDVINRLSLVYNILHCT